MMAALLDAALLLGLDAAVLYFTLRLLNLKMSEIFELPAFPLLADVLKSPAPAPDNDTLDESTEMAPPVPRPVVLLVIWPPATIIFATLAVIVPALPAPLVVTEILAASATVRLDAVTAMCPALPVPAVVVKRPLLGLPVKVMLPTPSTGPAPVIMTEPALSAMLRMLPPETESRDSVSKSS